MIKEELVAGIIHSQCGRVVTMGAGGAEAWGAGVRRGRRGRRLLVRSDPFLVQNSSQVLEKGVESGVVSIDYNSVND